ncbi:MAG TPA: ROK family transcriptional regulator [Anaerolineales bacterium]
MDIYTNVDQSFVRELNLSSVLRRLHDQGTLSRAQLALVTGLNKSTVSILVEELLQRGLIRETGINSNGTGRPATLLEINPQAGGIIGLELGVDFVTVLLTDFVGNVLWRNQRSVDPAEGEEPTIKLTLDLIDEAIKDCTATRLRVLGLGVSTPGTVDLKEKVLVFAPNLHWRNIPLGRIYSDHVGLPVFIDNDGNAAAVGEHLFGMARQTRNFIFVFAGVGIGGGLFLNNELYRGNNGFAGEIGHSPLLWNPAFQTPCHCGNRGCWETNANQYSIIRRAEACLEVKRSTIISRLMEQNKSPLSIPLIKEAADLGDQVAIDIFTETGEVMGLGIASLVNIFNPEKVILGGPLSVVGDYLLPGIKQSVKDHALPEISDQVDILLSSFRTDSSVFGAIALVVNNILLNPIQVSKEVMQESYIEK